MRAPVLLAPFALAAALLLAPLRGEATPAGYITKRSPYDVGQTLDRLADLLNKNGFSIVTRLDQRAIANKGGERLPATELLIFSLPEFDAALLRSDRSTGLELPLRALAWEDTSGRVNLTYPDPDRFAQRFNVTNQPVAVEHMTRLLDKLTDEAVKP